jgi:putative tryptophan/tyrosine transport system substrate-binding protein
MIGTVWEESPMPGMRRREFITLLGGAAASWPLAARAQQSNRLRLVGVLLAMAPSDPEAQLRVKAFEAALRELGWTEGRNLRLEYRWVPGDASLLRGQATELVGLAPDLILATSTPVLAALRQENPLPIVFVQVTDPVGDGFVPNLARPGGFLTGFTSFEFTICSKWLEALKHVAPKVRRVALMFNPDTAPFARKFWQPVEDAASSFDVEPIQAPVRDVGEIEHAIEAFARDANGGLMVLPDVSTTNHRNLIIALAARHRLPAVYPYRHFAASGGLMSYGSDLADVYRRAASYVDRILKGAVPGDLPVQAPAKFEFVINLRTANALGLTVPPRVLGRADEVIE